MAALTAPGTPLSELAGQLGPKTIEKIEAAGISTIEKLADMTPEQLMEIPGIGEKMVDKIQLAVAAYFQSLEKPQREVSGREWRSDGRQEIATDCRSCRKKPKTARAEEDPDLLLTEAPPSRMNPRSSGSRRSAAVASEEPTPRAKRTPVAAETEEAESAGKGRQGISLARPMTDENQIRINELARELEVKAKAIIDLSAGSSASPKRKRIRARSTWHVAEKVRQHLQGSGRRGSSRRSRSEAAKEAQGCRRQSGADEAGGCGGPLKLARSGCCRAVLRLLPPVAAPRSSCIRPAPAPVAAGSSQPATARAEARSCCPWSGDRAPCSDALRPPVASGEASAPPAAGAQRRPSAPRTCQWRTETGWSASAPVNGSLQPHPGVRLQPLVRGRCC